MANDAPKETQAEATERASAEERVQKANLALAAAAQEAAEAGAGLSAAVTRDVAPMLVEVNPNNTIGHGDKQYFGEGYPLAPEGHKGNDTVTLEGPVALALMMQGVVTVKGTAPKGDA